MSIVNWKTSLNKQEMESIEAFLFRNMKQTWTKNCEIVENM